MLLSPIFNTQLIKSYGLIAIVAVLLIVSANPPAYADNGETQIRNKMDQLLNAYKQMTANEPDCPVNTKGFNEGLDSTIKEYRNKKSQVDKQQFLTAFEDRINNTIHAFKTMSDEDIRRECDKERSHMTKQTDSNQENERTAPIINTPTLTEKERQQEINRLSMERFYRSEKKLMTLFNDELNATNDMSILCMGYSPEDARKRINAASDELIAITTQQEEQRMRSIEKKIRSLTNEDRNKFQTGCRMMTVRMKEAKQKRQQDKVKAREYTTKDLLENL